MLSAGRAIIEPRQPVPGSTANNDNHTNLITASYEPYRAHPQQATPLHNGTVWPHTEQPWSCGARHQERNWIHRPWTPEANLTSWDSTTRPPIACIFGAKKFWFHSCGGQHLNEIESLKGENHLLAVLPSILLFSTIPCKSLSNHKA